MNEPNAPLARGFLSWRGGFRPGFFWLLIMLTWLLIVYGLPGVDFLRGGPLVFSLISWPFALAGSIVNILRWRRLGFASRAGLVLLALFAIKLTWFWGTILSWHLQDRYSR